MFKRVFFFAVFYASIGVSQSFGDIKGAVVLIPGTLNSVAPGHFHTDPTNGEWKYFPYFSSNIVRTLESQGFAVYVVQHLQWYGTFEANGRRSYDQLKKWYLKRFPLADVPIALIGHSAGGFYALQAASENLDLPITSVVAVSTPLNGLKLANRAFHSSWVGKWLAWAMGKTPSFLDLGGLPEMTTNRVQNFLSRLRFENRFRFYAVGGRQNPPHQSLEKKNSAFLNPLYTFLSKLIQAPTDGIIDTESAYGTKASLKYSWEEDVKIHPLYEFQMPLDHSEQALDYRFYRSLGFVETQFVLNEQNRFYQSIGRLLNDDFTQEISR